MGEDGSEVRGMSREELERQAGGDDLVASMPDRTAAMTIASGTVSDKRRLVSFVYLLLRDNMPCGRMADIMQLRTTITAAKRVHLYQGLALDKLTGCAKSLTDGPVAPVRDWLALVYRQSPSEEQVPKLLAMLPAADDIETVFTNGWLARYAQYVAEELLALTDDDACS